MGSAESFKPRNLGEEYFGEAFQPEHYHISTQPLVAAVYIDFVRALKLIPGVTDAREIETLKVDEDRKVITNNHALSAFCIGGKLSIVRLYLPSGGSPGYGITLDSPIQEELFTKLEDFAGLRDAAGHWQRAKELGFTELSATEYEQNKTAEELRQDFRTVMLYQGRNRGGPLEMLAVVKMPEGAVDAGECFDRYSQEGQVVASAESAKPLLNRHLSAMGLDPTGGGVCGGWDMHVYLSDRKDSDYAKSFDALVAAHNMTILKDDRKK